MATLDDRNDADLPAGGKLASTARRLRRSGWLLVAANLVPLAGVLFLDWDLFLVLALFWLENVIIGGFGILKVGLASSGGLRRRVSSTLFFCLHYGVFMFAHAMLLISLFGAAANVEGGIESVPELASYLARGDVAIAAFALLVSHGLSFVSHFRGAGEGERLNRKDAMTLPYRRVLVTQAGLMGGGFAIEQFGTPLAGLVALVVIKTVADLGFHRREHRQLAPQDPGEPSPGQSGR